MLKEIVVDDYGISLHKKSERLILKKNGEVTEEHAIKELNDLVVSSKCGMVSIALIEELIQNGTQIHLIDYRHEPFVIVYTPAHHGSVKARREQFKSYDDERGVVVAKEIVRCKLQNQMNLIKYYLKSRDNEKTVTLLKNEISAIKDYQAKVKQLKGKCVDDIRQGLMTKEAHAAKHYWKCIKAILVDKIEFPGRNHHFNDIVNMMFNYGYGILGSRVGSSILRAGLEPYAGFIHTDRSGRPSLRLDFMEIFRQPVVDRAVVSLLTRGFQPETEVRDDESVFLDKKTKQKLAQNMFKRLETREDYHGKDFMVKTILQFQARSLASFFREGTEFRGYISRW
jgi:CRISPR-associated protein Cas1